MRPPFFLLLLLLLLLLIFVYKGLITTITKRGTSINLIFHPKTEILFRKKKQKKTDRHIWKTILKSVITKITKSNRVVSLKKE
jgi:hypothetical protein